MPTTTLTDREFLIGLKDGKPVIVAGELRIPRAGSDRLPAVVLVHGSGGADDDPCVERGVTMGYNADAHAKALNDVTEFLKSTFDLK